MARVTTTLALLAAISCGAPAVDLDGRPCDSNDACLPGYTCDLGICVPVGSSCELGRLESCATCEQDCTAEIANATPVCRATTADAFDCDYEGTCQSGYGDADTDRSNGCECTESGPEVCDNVDNDCNDSVDDGVPSCQCSTQLPSSEICDQIDNDCNQDIDDPYPCTGSDIRDCDSGGGPGSGSESCNVIACDWSGVCTEKDFDPPGQVTVSATPGNRAVSLAWDYPSDTDLSECVIRRRVNAAPSGHADGDLVHTLTGPSPGASDTYTDLTVSNGTLYHYGIYCRDLSGNWQDLATTDSALPVAPAPQNATDVAAAAGDGQVAITFTTPPAPFTECILTRKVGGPPASHTDVDDTLGTYTAADRVESYTDSTVSNGVTYYYAVFCHTDGTWNDDAIGGDNLASATPRSPSDCLPTDTVGATLMAMQCGHFGSSAGNAVQMGILLNTDCANTLASLTVHLHPAATLNTELSNFRLFLDADSSGTLNKGDTPLATAPLTGGAVTFTGMTTILPEATPVGVLVVADVGTVDAVPVFAAWQLTDAADIETGDPDPMVVLNGGTLTSPTHTLIFGRCTGGTDASDLGPGTFGGEPVRAIEGPGNTSSWSSGTGDENGWSQVGADFSRALADCQMMTTGSPNPIYANDDGNRSVFLKVNTGIPLGLPLCGLDMRLYSTAWTPADNSCSRDQLSDFESLYLYYYDAATTVAGEVIASVSVYTGPDVGPNTCNSHFADFDITALYDAATADAGTPDPLRLRIILEQGSGITSDDDKITTVPELFFRVSP